MLPVVISGKDHLVVIIKYIFFLWEARLRKTIVEIDFTSYLFPSAIMGITFYLL